MIFSKIKEISSSLFLPSLFVILLLVDGNSQTIFHRTYPVASGKSHLVVDGVQLKSGSYVTLEMQVDTTDSDIAYSDTLILSAFKPKGDILWSNKIYVDKSYSNFVIGTGSVTQGDNDTIYVTINSLVDSTKSNIVIGVTEAGKVDFAKAYNTADTLYSIVGNVSIIANKNTLTVGSNYASDSESGLYLSNKTSLGENIWGVRYQTVDTDNEVFTDLDYDVDSNYIVTGVSNSSFFLLKADTLGRVIWSKKLSNGIVSTSKNAKTAVLSGNSYVSIINDFANKQYDIVASDSVGNFQWAKTLVIPGLDSAAIVDIDTDLNGDIIIGGIAFIEIDSSYKFAMKLNPSGDVLWQNIYSGVDAHYNASGGVYGTNDGGSVFVNSVIEKGDFVPSMVKLDVNGTLMYEDILTCYVDIMGDVWQAITYTSDTVIWQIGTGMTSQQIGFDFVANTYDVPQLGLTSKRFCPDEPVVWTFNAATAGGIDYMWSTDTNRGIDTLTVSETGEYSVTVTINEHICYMLCDTIKLDRYSEPEASLSLSLGDFCNTGKVRLIAGYMPGHPMYKTITWSTNESNVESIEIGQVGQYSVTIVDQCDEVATAEISVDEFPQKITAAFIVPDIAVNCNQATITGTLKASGDSRGLGDERFLWSTGDTTKIIAINGSSVTSYSVTVTDGCGTTAVANYSIDIVGEGVKNITIISVESLKCLEGRVALTAVSSIFGNYQYIWTTGATTANIEVNSLGSYTVTVTDICGNTASSTYNFVFNGAGINGAAIQADSSAICTNKTLTLTGSGNPNGMFTYKWSNNSTTQSITVNAESTDATSYVVTVTDLCGNTATSMYTYARKPAQFTFQRDVTLLCTEKKLGIIPFITPNGSYTYRWSTGATSSSIIVDAAGSYNLTVTDVCGFTSSATVNVSETEFEVEDLISNLRFGSGNTSDCERINVKILFDQSNPKDPSVVKSYLWNNGGNTQEIEFEGVGVYSVTVTDRCNKEYTLSQEINLPVITYPTVFFPDGFGTLVEVDTMTREALYLENSFGPVNLPEYCFEAITDYEMYIFNRWNQEVFSATDIDDEWNGYNGSTKWPSDTYYWVVRYKLFGFENIQKGQITILR